eukprot:SAG22_NODE_4434_length_1270_cov_1.283518_1_plen_220_part_10
MQGAPPPPSAPPPGVTWRSVVPRGGLSALAHCMQTKKFVRRTRKHHRDDSDGGDQPAGTAARASALSHMAGVALATAAAAGAVIASALLVVSLSNSSWLRRFGDAAASIPALDIAGLTRRVSEVEAQIGAQELRYAGALGPDPGCADAAAAAAEAAEAVDGHHMPMPPGAAAEPVSSLRRCAAGVRRTVALQRDADLNRSSSRAWFDDMQQLINVSQQHA